ncbi:unnamed protein product, partial [Ostreobium quekettii]
AAALAADRATSPPTAKKPVTAKRLSSRPTTPPKDYEVHKPSRKEPFTLMGDSVPCSTDLGNLEGNHLSSKSGAGPVNRANVGSRKDEKSAVRAEKAGSAHAKPAWRAVSPMEDLKAERKKPTTALGKFAMGNKAGGAKREPMAPKSPPTKEDSVKSPTSSSSSQQDAKKGHSEAKTAVVAEERKSAKESTLKPQTEASTLAEEDDAAASIAVQKPADVLENLKDKDPANEFLQELGAKSGTRSLGIPEQPVMTVPDVDEDRACDEPQPVVAVDMKSEDPAPQLAAQVVELAEKECPKPTGQDDAEIEALEKVSPAGDFNACTGTGQMATAQSGAAGMAKATMDSTVGDSFGSKVDSKDEDKPTEELLKSSDVAQNDASHKADDGAQKGNDAEMEAVDDLALAMKDAALAAEPAEAVEPAPAVDSALAAMAGASKLQPSQGQTVDGIAPSNTPEAPSKPGVPDPEEKQAATGGVHSLVASTVDKTQGDEGEAKLGEMPSVDTEEKAGSSLSSMKNAGVHEEVEAVGERNEVESRMVTEGGSAPEGVVLLPESLEMQMPLKGKEEGKGLGDFVAPEKSDAVIEVKASLVKDGAAALDVGQGTVDDTEPIASAAEKAVSTGVSVATGDDKVSDAIGSEVGHAPQVEAVPTEDTGTGVDSNKPCAEDMSCGACEEQKAPIEAEPAVAPEKGDPVADAASGTGLLDEACAVVQPPESELLVTEKQSASAGHDEKVADKTEDLKDAVRKQGSEQLDPKDGNRTTDATAHAVPEAELKLKEGDVGVSALGQLAADSSETRETAEKEVAEQETAPLADTAPAAQEPGKDSVTEQTVDILEDATSKEKGEAHASDEPVPLPTLDKPPEEGELVAKLGFSVTKEESVLSGSEHADVTALPNSIGTMKVAETKEMACNAPAETEGADGAVAEVSASGFSRPEPSLAELEATVPVEEAGSQCKDELAKGVMEAKSLAVIGVVTIVGDDGSAMKTNEVQAADLTPAIPPEVEQLVATSVKVTPSQDSGERCVDESVLTATPNVLETEGSVAKSDGLIPIDGSGSKLKVEVAELVTEVQSGDVAKVDSIPGKDESKMKISSEQVPKATEAATPEAQQLPTETDEMKPKVVIECKRPEEGAAAVAPTVYGPEPSVAKADDIMKSAEDEPCHKEEPAAQVTSPSKGELAEQLTDASTQGAAQVDAVVPTDDGKIEGDATLSAASEGQDTVAKTDDSAPVAVCVQGSDGKPSGAESCEKNEVKDITAEAALKDDTAASGGVEASAVAADKPIDCAVEDVPKDAALAGGAGEPLAAAASVESSKVTSAPVEELLDSKGDVAVEVPGELPVTGESFDSSELNDAILEETQLGAKEENAPKSKSARKKRAKKQAKKAAAAAAAAAAAEAELATAKQNVDASKEDREVQGDVDSGAVDTVSMSLKTEQPDPKAPLPASGEGTGAKDSGTSSVERTIVGDVKYAALLAEEVAGKIVDQSKDCEATLSESLSGAPASDGSKAKGSEKASSVENKGPLEVGIGKDDAAVSSGFECTNRDEE